VRKFVLGLKVVIAEDVDIRMIVNRVPDFGALKVAYHYVRGGQ